MGGLCGRAGGGRVTGRAVGLAVGRGRRGCDSVSAGMTNARAWPMSDVMPLAMLLSMSGTFSVSGRKPTPSMASPSELANILGRPAMYLPADAADDTDVAAAAAGEAATVAPAARFTGTAAAAAITGSNNSQACPLLACRPAPMVRGARRAAALRAAG